MRKSNFYYTLLVGGKWNKRTWFLTPEPVCSHFKLSHQLSQKAAPSQDISMPPDGLKFLVIPFLKLHIIKQAYITDIIKLK